MRPRCSAINVRSIAFLKELRADWEKPTTPCVISGAIGPRGDGYKAGNMDAAESETYHGAQIAAFVEGGADMVTAYTLNNINEAIGIARAATAQRIPAVISFTVETDGRLVNGETLREAIEAVDRATQASPEYFLINCAHPTHFEHALKADEAWVKRIHGVRANASTKSHAELDESATLDAGDPQDLGRRYLRSQALVSGDAHSGRLLRYRPSPCGGHLRRLPAAARAQRLTPKQKWPGLLPAIFICVDRSQRRGGAVPGGGGGSDACPPLSSGVMLRIVTRRLISLGPSIGSFGYCSP